jgi:dolichol-phosphate mannosyltransferase
VRKLAVVVPVYNEAEAVPAFHQALASVLERLAYSAAIYYVDDGSTDGTGEALTRIAAADKRVTVLELSRNFGHQAALAAGLDRATGDVIITMDGDGQHPCELIIDMLGLIDAGYDVVLTQRMREGGAQLPFSKRVASDLFYVLINRLSDTRVVAGSADFRAITCAVADTLRQMGEYHRFLRGMIAWTGYKTAILPYVPSPRLAGRTKYSTVKMLRLANAAIFSFSLVPIQIVVGLGALFVVLAIVEAFYVGGLWLVGQRDVLAPGWSSLMFVLLFVGGMIMVSLGIIGIYIGYIFQEVKRRPVYIVRSTHHADSEQQRSAQEQRVERGQPRNVGRLDPGQLVDLVARLEARQRRASDQFSREQHDQREAAALDRQGRANAHLQPGFFEELALERVLERLAAFEPAAWQRPWLFDAVRAMDDQHAPPLVADQRRDADRIAGVAQTQIDESDWPGQPPPDAQQPPQHQVRITN